MSHARPKELAHELIERMAPSQVSAVVGLLETMLDPFLAPSLTLRLTTNLKPRPSVGPWRSRSRGWHSTPAKGFRTRKLRPSLGSLKKM